MFIATKQDGKLGEHSEWDEATLTTISTFVRENYMQQKESAEFFLHVDDETTIHFDSGNVVKLGYYAYKMNISHVGKVTLDKIYYNFKIISTTEEKFNKPFYMFTKKEISDLIAEHYMITHSVASTVSLIYTLRDAANVFPFAFKEVEAWNELGSFPLMRDVMKESNHHKYISKNMLLSFAETAINRQFAVVLVLLYNGVKSSLVEEIDEMQRIKKEDITEKGINIKNGTSPRFIHLSKIEIALLKEAASQQYLIRIAKPSALDLENGEYNYSESELIDSEYLLRPTKRTYKNDEKKNQDQYAKTITLKTRANELLKEFSTLMEKEIKIKDVTNSGKVYAIEEYMKAGHSLSDALTKTLIKFGEWEPKLTVKEEKEDKGNKQRKTRLKRLYIINK